MPPALPSVRDYADYRRFLRDHYAARKRLDPAFSYAVFARRAGVSRIHLKRVLDGMGLSPASIRGYARGLNLAGPDAECFSLLVNVNQAAGGAARRAASAKLRHWI